MKHKREIYYAAATLIVIVALGAGLHFWRIGYPSWPVFDEIHFATYSADYALGRTFEDIHPPLGKMIFASVLAFYPTTDLVGAHFLDVVRAPDGTIAVIPHEMPFGNFPYVALRAVSALFGIALPVALYFLMRGLGAGRVPSSLAALFIVFDNAFLVDTRLILVDGMFIAFGVAALALYFHERKWSVAAGAVWGLALAVKLTAVVFAAPVLAACLLAIGARSVAQKSEWAHFARFAVTGIVVLAVIFIAGTFYFSSASRLNALTAVKMVSPNSPMLAAAWVAAHPLSAYVSADIAEMKFSFRNYLSGAPAVAESPWYLWPVMQTPMPLFTMPDGSAQYGWGNIVFTGNPVVWFGSTFAVIVAVAVARRYAKNKKYALLVLLSGYVGALLPFILFVHRSTFLYHYLPALVFAVGIAAWFIGEWLGVREWTDLTPRKAVFLTLILVIVVVGFAYTAHFTYGL